MKTLAPDKVRQKRELLDGLLDELSEECRNTTDLIAKLHARRSGKHRRSDILSELCASIVHLHAHTKDLPELIYDEYDEEE
ncbi:MAG: hypothetical protein M3Z35_09170 [Nitrospirota bacterium]|nr:hypothetical protein [Nitrospirota bacterium]